MDLYTVAFPDTLTVVRALLSPLGPEVRLAPPPDFPGGELITLAELPGHTDPDDVTYYALALVSSWGATRGDAVDLAGRVQVRILSAVLTEAAGVLIDSTGLYTGSVEGPDLFPDERRIDAVYQLGWRRQFRP